MLAIGRRSFEDPISTGSIARSETAHLRRYRHDSRRTNASKAPYCHLFNAGYITISIVSTACRSSCYTNADDALGELEEIEAYPSKPVDPDTLSIPEELRRVVVACDDEFVAFLHWGRPINWTGKEDFPGRERGYHRDLQKMLVLSASDKQLDDDLESSRAETGKFGLGFKSVLLACDRPVIVSGRLQAEVVGGLVPRPITDASRFRRILERESPGSGHRGTLIGMSVTGAARDRMLERFFQLAGILCVFARSVREIGHVTQNRERRSYGWRPVPISNVLGLEHGSLSVSGSTHNGRLTRLRQLSPLTDDNLLIFRDRTLKGRHYTERPGDPPTGLQDSSFGAGCFGNAKSS